MHDKMKKATYPLHFANQKLKITPNQCPIVSLFFCFLLGARTQSVTYLCQLVDQKLTMTPCQCFIVSLFFCFCQVLVPILSPTFVNQKLEITPCQCPIVSLLFCFCQVLGPSMSGQDLACQLLGPSLLPIFLYTIDDMHLILTETSQYGCIGRLTIVFSISIVK